MTVAKQPGPPFRPAEPDACREHSDLPAADVEDQKRSRSTARSVREFVGTWVGDDRRERIAEVYAARGEIRS